MPPVLVAHLHTARLAHTRCCSSVVTSPSITPNKYVDHTQHICRSHPTSITPCHSYWLLLIYISHLVAPDISHQSCSPLIHHGTLRSPIQKHSVLTHSKCSVLSHPRCSVLTLPNTQRTPCSHPQTLSIDHWIKFKAPG